MKGASPAATALSPLREEAASRLHPDGLQSTGAGLVLSLFPGIGLLDLAFEEAGFSVVRGPDPLWGGDIRRFHAPPGRFQGIIGGPPCQPFSQLVHMVRANGFEPKHENLIPEFERIVEEAQPDWFIMEEVRGAPLPEVAGYRVHSQMVNARHVGSTQNRERRISFGTRDGRSLRLQTETFEPLDWDFAVTGDARVRPVAMLSGGKPKGNETGGRTSSLNRGGGSLPFEAMCELQGLPRDFLAEAPFTVSGKRQAVGNGVPLPLGKAIARAVLAAQGMALREDPRSGAEAEGCRPGPAGMRPDTPSIPNTPEKG